MDRIRGRGYLWVLAAGLIAALLTGPGRAVLADSLTNDKIEEEEGAKKAAEEQKKALEGGRTDIEELLKSLESSKSNLKNYVKTLDRDLAAIGEKIETLNGLIEQKQEEIRLTKEALEEARQREEEQYESMKARIRFMYERGEASFVELLFQAKDFSDFLTRAEFIGRVSEYDRKLLKDYQKTKEQITAAERKLQEEEEELAAAKSELDNEQEAVNQLVKAKEQEIKVYENDIGNKEQLLSELEAEIAAQDEMIKALEASIAAERKRLEAENKAVRNYDGGRFAFPAPSYTRISDEYGMRIHPILNVEQFHNGVDLAAPGGTPILAAYDGMVVVAAYSGTMGNYVMIDHGDGLVTVYLHALAIQVSQGQEVGRGQQIATVGSTGRSTGNHLHFSVRKNGNYVNPMGYFG